MGSASFSEDIRERKDDWLHHARDLQKQLVMISNRLEEIGTDPTPTSVDDGRAELARMKDLVRVLLREVRTAMRALEAATSELSELLSIATEPTVLSLAEQNKRQADDIRVLRRELEAQEGATQRVGALRDRDTQRRDGLQSELQRVQRELDETRNALSKASLERRALQRNLAELRQQVKTEQDQRTAIERKLAAAEGEAKRMEAGLRKLRETTCGLPSRDCIELAGLTPPT